MFKTFLFVILLVLFLNIIVNLGVITGVQAIGSVAAGVVTILIGAMLGFFE
jgi:hypothetical protein